MLEKKKFNELVKSVERYESKKSLSHRRAKSTRLPRDFEFYKLNETKEKGKNEKKYLAYIYLDFCLPLFHIPNVYIYVHVLLHIFTNFSVNIVNIYPIFVKVSAINIGRS